MNRLLYIVLLLVFPFFASSQTLRLAVKESGVYKITNRTLRKYGLSRENPYVRFYTTPGNSLDQLSRGKLSYREIPSKYYGNKKKYDSKGYYYIYTQAAKEEDGANNPYARTNYVYIKLGQKGKEIGEENLQIGNSGAFLIKERVEQEIYNVVRSGRSWLGDFINSEYFQKRDLPKAMTNKPIELEINLVSTSTVANSLQVYQENVELGKVDLPQSLYKPSDTFGRYRRVGNAAKGTFKWNHSGSLDLRLEVEKQERNGDGAYLDYYNLSYEFNPKYKDGQVEVEKESGDMALPKDLALEFAWNIDNAFEPKEILGDATAGRKIQFFSDRTAFTVSNLEEMEPNGSLPEDINYVIICPKAFVKPANMLASYRSSGDTLVCGVATLEDIYYFYSGGKPDPSAIRNYLAEVYPNGLKYVLLFGDASFDFKNNYGSKFVRTENLVPAYQSIESLEPIYSFSSDDFFGFLQNGLGDWPEGKSIQNSYFISNDRRHLLDVAIGRFPVKNLEEAYAVVNKVIAYENSAGLWQNKMLFVADDGDFNQHIRDAEFFSKLIEEDFHVDKLYLDEYPQSGEGNSKISIEGNAKLNAKIEDGVYLINFNGHGGERGWTEEKVLTNEDIRAWRNVDKLPIFFTATCEFGRYDDPSLVSGAEIALLKERGGAIALLTTTRPVFSSTNFSINRAFYKELLNQENERLGDVFKKTKNAAIEGELNRNFTLLGDPALKLLPRSNRIHVSSNLDTVTLSKWNEWELEFPELSTGEVEVKLFAPSILKKTLGESSSVFSFQEKEEVAWQGKTIVSGGKAKFRFKLPKDLPTGSGAQAIFYLKDDQTNSYAVLSKLIFEASDNKAAEDSKGPTISLQKEEENDSFTLLLEDENGINLIRKNGFSIPITINDSIEIDGSNFILNHEESTSLLLKIPKRYLMLGTNVIQVSTKDTYNNASTASFSMSSHKKDLELFEFSVYPNPVNSYLNFKFDHNSPGQDLDISIEIYNSQGKVIKQKSYECYICQENSSFGMNIEPDLFSSGMYHYRILVKNKKQTNNTIKSGSLIYLP